LEVLLAVTPHTHLDGVEFFKSGIVVLAWLTIFTALVSLMPGSWVGKFLAVVK